MNITEHLLCCLGEEGAEIAQDASKAMRFGPEDRYDAHSNRDRLLAEINDLMGVVVLLQELGLFPNIIFSPTDVARKRMRVLEFMRYAKSIGALQDPENKLDDWH